MKIIVLGYLVRGPIGGMAWHHLQYMLGLRQLGHNVLFVEDSDDYPSCYDPSKHEVGTDPSYGLKFASDTFSRLDFGELWAYYDAHSDQWLGPAADGAIRFCDDADAVINVSGVNPLRPWLEAIPHRVLIDTDPVFTQIRHLTNSGAKQRAEQHNAFFTFAESIGTDDCHIPDDGFPWKPTRQPIVLDSWGVSDGPSTGTFTTVMQWESYPSVDWNDQKYGMKSESFNLVRNLPRHTSTSLEMAIGGHRVPRSELQRDGWRLMDSLTVTRTPWTYQRYIQDSRGEFSVAKHGYVVAGTGWFSERTACYLASGRPAVVQDTGFSRHLPCGHGLWAYKDLQSAVDSLDSVQSNYHDQCRAARDLAAEYFDSRKVLSSLLERAQVVERVSSQGST
jgi:hypothetical protein